MHATSHATSKVSWLALALCCACSAPSASMNERPVVQQQGGRSAPALTDAGMSLPSDFGSSGRLAPVTPIPSAGSGAVVAPGTNGGPADATRSSFCKGGVAVTTARGQSETCPGRIASQAFRYGLCSCKDVVAWGAIASDAYDSTQGPMSPATMSNGGGAIGINGGFTGAGLFIPGGSVTVAGPQGLSLPGQVSIFGDLRVAGTLTALSVTVSTVSHNAWFGGAMTGGGALGVSGDVHQPVGAERSVVLTVGGKDVREPVHIDPPCPCGEKEFLDVAAIVADGKQNNHNTDAAFDPANLANVATDLRVELPCGRLYVPSFKVQATLTMSVQGKTALLIDGDMQVTGTLALELGPDADLDIFVGGNLVLNALKSPANLRPANLRLYVGGAGDIKLPMSGFSGNLYAPRAAVTASGSQALFGSVFAGNFTAAGWTTIHYDTSVVAEGNDCKPPDECNDCTGCAATSACIGGHCGTCSTDADCCQPLTCYAGKCQPLILL